MALLLAAIIAFIPLAVAPGWFFYFDVTPKVVLLLLGTAVVVVWWAAADEGMGLDRVSRTARWFVLVLCGMAASLVVSTAASVKPVLSLGGSNWRYWGLVTQLAALAFAYLLAARCAGRANRLRLVLRAVAASGVIVAAYGIAQYFGFDPLLDPRAYHAGEGIFTIVRPPSTLGHADYSANWLLFVVFVCVALGLSESRAAGKWLAWSAAAISSAAIILSGTRAPLIGLFIGAILIAIPQLRRFKMRHLAAPAAIVVLGAIFYISPAGRLLRARVHWAMDEPAGGARLLLWRDTLRMSAARWPAGYGPDTFIPAFGLHQSADLARAYPDFYHESPHNIFLDALVSQGLPGLVLLAGLTAIGFAAGWILRQHPIAIALAAGLAAMTISQQFACFTMPTALAYYAAVAMLVSITISKPAQAVRHRPRRLAAAIPCALLLAFFGARLWMSEAALADVRRDLDAHQISEAANRYADYQRWRWPSASADLWYSRRLAQIAASNIPPLARIEAFQQAESAAQRAPATTEAAFNAYYNLAAFYARHNDFAHTEQALRAAISYAPNWFKTHWMLAQVLEAAARLNEAESEAARAVTLDGGKHPEVMHTLASIRTALASANIEPAHK